MKHLGFAAIVSSLLIVIGAPAYAAFVDAKHSVYFAGHTLIELNGIVTADPTYDAGDYFGDLSDAGTVPNAIDITGLGPAISISADGIWTHGSAAPTGPEGKGVLELTRAQYGIFGISLLTAGLNMLVGVFLDGSSPAPGAAPASLSTDDPGDDMTMPLLSQSFAIGASLSDIMVPVGATRCSLACTTDSSGPTIVVV